MTIKKKIQKHIPLEEVIERGAHVKADNESEAKEWKNFCLRIKTKTIERIAKALEDREGISMTGWILEAINKELKRIENDQ